MLLFDFGFVLFCFVFLKIRSHYVLQAGPEFTAILLDPPASASRVLELKVRATVPSNRILSKTKLDKAEEKGEALREGGAQSLAFWSSRVTVLVKSLLN